MPIELNDKRAGCLLFPLKSEKGSTPLALIPRHSPLLSVLAAASPSPFSFPELFRFRRRVGKR
jgi:hypothetical protein